MPQPLDIALGLELPPERAAAIDAVRVYCADENSMEFWDRVKRVQAIWGVPPAVAAKAVDVVWPYLSPDGEYGRKAVFDGDIDALITAIGRALQGV